MPASDAAFMRHGASRLRKGSGSSERRERELCDVPAEIGVSAVRAG
jgi:hypothetical protein